MTYIDINGRTIREPNGAHYMLTEKNYKKYLQHVRSRLEMEVSPYITYIQELHKADPEAPLPGFFSLVRMVMPVVDAVATVQGVEPPTILAALGAPAPNLMWNLYRDMLLHNDELMFGAVGGRGIATGIGVTFEGEKYPDIFKTDYRFLDIGHLYRQLLEYLDEQSDNASKDKVVKIVSGIEYDTATTDPAVRAILAEVADDR